MDDLEEGRRGLAAWIILGNTRWRIDGTARHRGGSRSFRNDGGRAGQQHCGGRDDGATPQYFLHWPRFWSRLCTPHWKICLSFASSIRFKKPCNERITARSEEHTSELQSLMRISYAVFCLKKKKKNRPEQTTQLMKQQTQPHIT